MANPTLEKMEYRVVIVRPASRAILALRSASRLCLPRVTIPGRSRPAQQLRKGIEALWGFRVLVQDILTYEDAPLAVAELLTFEMSSDFEEVTLDQIVVSDLSKRERHEFELILAGLPTHPYSRIGWIDEAIEWIESATGRTFSSNAHIEQFNAGGGFALLKFRSEDGCCYWMKATGEPNRHEFTITSCLSYLCPGFLPTLVATKKEWNAWLTEDAGNPLCDPASAVLVGGARSFALLQRETINSIGVLLAAGAFDQRLSVLRNHISDVMEYLIEAMARQTSTKVVPLSPDRILVLGEILREACCRLEALNVPDALIHNDLNLGNILYDGARSVFTDWSEAAVGNPFLSFARFSQLNVDAGEDFRGVYRKCWREHLSERSTDEACSLAPLLAIYAYLYGRGGWLKDTSSVPPQFESYARSLARHMDRAAQEPLLLETLCR